MAESLRILGTDLQGRSSALRIAGLSFGAFVLFLTLPFITVTEQSSKVGGLVQNQQVWGLIFK